MIWIILIISLIVFGVGLYLMDDCTYDILGALMAVFGGLVGLVSIITAIILIISVSNLKVIDERIAMYEEENAKIELQIATVVEQYQKYETDIFKEVAPESSMTLVALYPELKADSLVQQQIDIYVANNEKIKELRESKIGGKVARWWLHFGG